MDSSHISYSLMISYLSLKLLFLFKKLSNKNILISMSLRKDASISLIISYTTKFQSMKKFYFLEKKCPCVGSDLKQRILHY